MRKYLRPEQKEKRGSRMICYAVIDTNVFISALLSKNSDAATVKVFQAILDGRIVPLYHKEILADMDDLIFYEVVMEKRDDDAYLVTGNQKHYPIRDFIVTPAEMMRIIEQR